ncbi:MAG: hypothetical protein JWR80_8600 [Bradyrhizobium sp.]|nr:hypothetical protein [Bradyrhizobium sp.]
MPPHTIGPRRRGARIFVAALLATALSGCIGMRQQRLAPGEEPVLIGPEARDNRTPMDPAFACFAGQLSVQHPRRLVIAVGDVRDLTGKYSVNEGTAITQGGALMVASALGKFGGPIVLAERFDPTIGERELGYTDRRQLGDGQAHAIAGTGSTSNVPWLPYYGGSITASDYYLVGGITELNYDIRSGGAEVRVGQVGPKVRTYTQSVAIDLRIVDTRSLLVVKTISLTKQFTGYEVGFNTFRFFGSELFDINIGAKGQEPLQLAIRATLEEATLRLVAAVAGTDPTNCLAQRSWTPAAVSPRPSDQLVTSAATTVEAVARALNGVQPNTDGPVTLAFEPGSEALAPVAASLVDRIALAPKTGQVDIFLVGRDSETPDPAVRDALTDRRVAAVIARLASLDIRADRVRLVWRPAATQSSPERDSAGFRRLAQLRVAR